MTETAPIPDDMIKTCIFVGRPDEELPLSGFSNVKRFFDGNPGKSLIIVVRSSKDAEECTLGISALELPQGIKLKILIWDDDAKLLDVLSRMLPELAWSKIHGKTWLTCKNGHINPLRREPVEKCAECGNDELTATHGNEEELRQFCDIFGKVVSLINFDTRSGKILHSLVNPTANILKNMPYAVREKGEPPLESSDRFQSGVGKPAYLCAAGPSLEDALPHLKRLQDTGIVCCVGRLFKTLWTAGIRVDYTFSCEMFDWDSAIFDGVTREMAGDTVMVFPPVCAPATVQKWPGKRMCMWDMRTAELLGRPDYTLGGNSVAHHQLNFAAEILQCEPLILIGQDLAYTKPSLHTHAGEQPANWPDEVKDMDRNLQAEAWAASTNEPPFYPECHLQNVAAGTAIPIGPVMVRTSPSYKDFGTLFTILIQKHGRKVYNCCPNGLKIEGAEYLNLEGWTGLLSPKQDAPVESAPSQA